MDISVLEEGERSLKLHITGTDRATVSALRRTLMSDVPKMAVTKVRFELGTVQDNATGEQFEAVNALPDEVIAHRLAMLPIPTFLDEFVFQDECPNCAALPESDRGCPLCQIAYTLSARGITEGRTVRAGDMNVLGDEKLQVPPSARNIPITKLFAGQYLEFYAFASLGRGRDHAKWQAVVAPRFSPREVAVLNDKKAAEVFFELDLGFTAKDFDKKGRMEDIMTVERLQRALEHVKPGTFNAEAFAEAITMETVPGEFVFTFECDESLAARDLFNHAAKVLSERFVRLGEELVEAF